MVNMSDDWCTIESDPGVFTGLCEEVGVKGIQFEEMYSLEADTLDAACANPIGLVFLFNHRGGEKEHGRAAAKIVQGEDYGLFFMKQVIQNACGTQAILSVLLNAASNDKLDLGNNLKQFREFTVGLDPEMRGLALSNSEQIREAHNSFRRRSSFEIVEDKTDDPKKGEAFHFVGYVCVNGKVFELDGCQSGPILIGDAPAHGQWTTVALEEIKKRIAEYTPAEVAEGASAELRFNLMAIVPSKLAEAEKAVERNRFLRQRANISLASQGEDVELTDEVDDDEAPADLPTFEDLSIKELGDLKAIVAKCSTEIDEGLKVVGKEKEVRSKWTKENALRKHDLVPLALCALRHLARRKELMPAFQKGKESHLKRVEEKKAQEAKTGKA